MSAAAATPVVVEPQAPVQGLTGGCSQTMTMPSVTYMQAPYGANYVSAAPTYAQPVQYTPMEQPQYVQYLDQAPQYVDENGQPIEAPIQYVTADGQPVQYENVQYVTADGQPIQMEGVQYVTPEGQPLQMGAGVQYVTADGQPVQYLDQQPVQYLEQQPMQYVDQQPMQYVTADGQPISATGRPPVFNITPEQFQVLANGGSLSPEEFENIVTGGGSSTQVGLPPASSMVEMENGSGTVASTPAPPGSTPARKSERQKKIGSKKKKNAKACC